ncbi:TIGR02450 family Trp-rich protein [Paraglaciecola sp. L3A3]|uniref:TIGR02450 family Trp-rich protein n=1 Tax=Paraglaciecola sp. L3A3 TaxID=2686358 RepID=UPI00131A9977|nr:TIGR02450 family Trp-rich protein [Paraglaciecola sp. L3A3]
MNNINPKKLLNSKWTAVEPLNKEKHFLVSDIEFDEEGIVVLCSIEAIMSKLCILIDWRDLKDETKWIFGWK